MEQATLEQADQLRRDGEYDDAIALYNQLVEATDGELAIKALHGRAMCYLMTGLFDESIEALEQVRDRQPRYVPGRVDLFKSYCMLSMYDEAKGEAQAILAIDPTNEEVHKQLAYLEEF